MKTVDELVLDALGGSTAVSRQTYTPLSTVHSWRRNGIPRSRRAHLDLIAERGGKSIDWSTGALKARDGSGADHVGTDTVCEGALS